MINTQHNNRFNKIPLRKHISRIILGISTVILFSNQLLSQCDEGFLEIEEDCYWKKDIDILHEFISNSVNSIDMDLDEDEDGVISPLELGNQTWREGRLISLFCVNRGLSGVIPENIVATA